MPYTQDQFENDDLWKIYEATIGGGGSSPLSGYKVIAGIIYMDSSNNWQLLNNVDHETLNIDSVSDLNGIITIDYSTIGATASKVVGGWISGGGNFANAGVTHELSMGLNSTDVFFYVQQEYSGVFYVTYTTAGGWSVVDYGSTISRVSPSILGSGTNHVTISHQKFFQPCTDWYVLGANHASFRVEPKDSGYAYDNTRVYLYNNDGSPRTPQDGDQFIVKRVGKYLDATNDPQGAAGGGNYPNSRASSTNQFTLTPLTKRITDFSDWRVSGGGGFNNFQILIILK